MGTWSAPTTVARAARLAELVERPVLAGNAADLLYHVLGSDSLFDMLDSARSDVGRTADVRPLIALELDLMLDWTDPDDFVMGWEAGAADELRRSLGLCVAAGDPDGVLAAVSSFDSDDQARAAVAGVLGLDRGEAAKMQVSPGGVPGVRKVVGPDGTAYRFEDVWGVVNEAPGNVAAPSPRH